jgi:hypothetical protein
MPETDPNGFSNLAFACVNNDANCALASEEAGVGNLLPPLKLREEDPADEEIFMGYLV